MMAPEASSQLLDRGVDNLADLGIRVPILMMAQEASNPDLLRDRGILDTARTIQEVDIQVETTLMMMTPKGNPQLARGVGVREAGFPRDLGIRVPIILMMALEVECRGVPTQFLNSLKDRGNRARRIRKMNRSQAKRRSRSCRGSSLAESKLICV